MGVQEKMMAGYPKEPDVRFKSFVYDQFARIAKALSSAPRLMLINILCHGEHTVEELSHLADLSVANTSRHLQVLKGVNLVTFQRRGNHVVYQVADESVVRFFAALRDVALERLADLRQALTEISSATTRIDLVGRDELLTRLDRGDIVALDVRPEQEYQRAHIPGSISVPMQDLRCRLDELEREKEIVVLCRGKYCVLADEAVPILRSEGFRARRAEDGAVDWELDGLPVEPEKEDK